MGLCITTILYGVPKTKIYKPIIKYKGHGNKKYA
jgi:hypothetical protein